MLWVIKGLGPGGAERLLVEAARSVTAVGGEVSADLACAYVVPWKRHLVGDLESVGVDCQCVGRGRRGGGMWWPVRLARLVRRGGFDVVHVHSPLPGSVARLAVRTLPRSRRPIVLTTEHNAWPTYRLPTRWLNRVTSTRDRRTFAVSAEVAASISGPAARRTQVLTHGVDVASVRNHRDRRDSMRAELGLPEQAVVVATIANYREQKDYPNLLNACALLRDRGVDLRVVCVGQGPLHEEIEALHASLRLGAVVQLLGHRADALDVLAAADVFVLGSAWEGLPVALMEATSMGLPCVLTDVGGMRDALGDDGAVWVAPGDAEALAAALETVVADADLRVQLSARSTDRAVQFDNAAVAAELGRWYWVGAPAAPAAPSPPSGIEVRAARPDDLAEILVLCRRSLGWTDGDWESLFRWKHLHNRFGTSPMWVAVADGRIVGLRTFMRWEFERDGRPVRAVRAVDTATDPDYQGRGLFTLLTLHAVRELRAEGVEMVFNTPNDKSRPGYLKMGWQDVGVLAPVVRPVRLRSVRRILRSRVPAEHWPLPMDVGRSVEEWLAAEGAHNLPMRRRTSGVRTVFDTEFVHWRFTSPLQPCRVVGKGDTFAIVELRQRGQVTELVRLVSAGDPREVDRLLLHTARAVGADVVLRLGRPALMRGFVGVPGAGPKLTCLMLADVPMPRIEEWHLFMSDVALF